MEVLLKQACADHDLSAIGVNVFDTSTSEVTVYVHWKGDGCASGSGVTFTDALACAVAEMAKRRERRVA